MLGDADLVRLVASYVSLLDAIFVGAYSTYLYSCQTGDASLSSLSRRRFDHSQQIPQRLLRISGDKLDDNLLENIGNAPIRVSDPCNDLGECGVKLDRQHGQTVTTAGYSP